jgi:hypothetical protein
MANIPVPTTVSPARLALHYNILGNIQHSCSVRLVAGVDIQDVASIRTDAAQLADAVRACMANQHAITGWSIVMPDGRLGYTEPFSTVLLGTHGTNGNELYSLSHTMLGKAKGVSVGSAAGRTKLVLFCGGVLFPSAGEKYIAETADTAFHTLATVLNGSLRYWADIWGQKADTTGRVSVQFNAHVQRVIGS